MDILIKQPEDEKRENLYMNNRNQGKIRENCAHHNHDCRRMEVDKQHFQQQLQLPQMQQLMQEDLHIVLQPTQCEMH